MVTKQLQIGDKNYKMMTLLKHAPLPRWHARQGSAQKWPEGLKKIALIDRDFEIRNLRSENERRGFSKNATEAPLVKRKEE